MALFLKETTEYSPNSHAHTISTNPFSMAIHPSSLYLAYATRHGQVVLHNYRTDRSSVIHRGGNGQRGMTNGNPITNIQFTQKYILISEQKSPQIFLYSIKSEKLMKKLTGHRSKILKFAYCEQRSVFCSISHDACIIWNDNIPGQRLKTLKCSTSPYVCCEFSGNGQYLFTTFLDGNVYGWDLDSFQFLNTVLPAQSQQNFNGYQIASSYNRLIICYSRDSVYIADYSLADTAQSKQFAQNMGDLIFSKNKLSQQSREKYPQEQPWNSIVFNKQQIRKIEFLNENNYMVVKTNKSLYISELSANNSVADRRLTTQNGETMRLEDPIYTFMLSQYSGEIIVVNKELTKVRNMKLLRELLEEQKIPLTNPLLNPGRQCPGGYAEKCEAIQQNYQGDKTYGYEGKQSYKIQPANQGIYHQTTNSGAWSTQKIVNFIQKHYILPDKYRHMIYQKQLGLPVSKSAFRHLENLGRHQCVKNFHVKFPIQNVQLREKMKDMISLLAHYSPIFSVAYMSSDSLATIIFPFICIFGADQFLCFEIIYQLFNSSLEFMYHQFPTANTELLVICKEIFEQDNSLKQILIHLQSVGISFTKFLWTLLENLFTNVLNRDCFLAVVDNIICNSEKISITIFMAIGFIGYNKSRIFSMKSQKSLDEFLSTEQTIDMSRFMKKVYSLYSKYGRYLEDRYPFRSIQSKKMQKYQEYTSYPQEEVHKYGKTLRKMQEKKYQQIISQEQQQEELAKQIDRKLAKVKRQADLIKIKNQAISLKGQVDFHNKQKGYFERGSSKKGNRGSELIDKMMRQVNQLQG